VFRKGTIVLGFALLAMLVVAAAANASSSGNSPGAVYTLTNSPAGNAVIAFGRGADGTLSPQGTFATGGSGSGSNLGSQGAVTLTGDGRQLLAVNAGSNSVSLFRVRPDGLELEAAVPSGGARPISVTVRDKLVYVLNAGGAGNIAGFVLDPGGLAALAGASQPLRRRQLRAGAGRVHARRRRARRDGEVVEHDRHVCDRPGRARRRTRRVTFGRRHAVRLRLRQPRSPPGLGGGRIGVVVRACRARAPR
jgi:hypothetical protein